MFFKIQTKLAFKKNGASMLIVMVLLVMATAIGFWAIKNTSSTKLKASNIQFATGLKNEAEVGLARAMLRLTEIADNSASGAWSTNEDSKNVVTLLADAVDTVADKNAAASGITGGEYDKKIINYLAACSPGTGNLSPAIVAHLDGFWSDLFSGDPAYSDTAATIDQSSDNQYDRSQGVCEPDNCTVAINQACRDQDAGFDPLVDFTKRKGNVICNWLGVVSPTTEVNLVRQNNYIISDNSTNQYMIETSQQMFDFFRFNQAIAQTPTIGNYMSMWSQMRYKLFLIYLINVIATDTKSGRRQVQQGVAAIHFNPFTCGVVEKPYLTTSKILTTE